VGKGEALSSREKRRMAQMTQSKQLSLLTRSGKGKGKKDGRSGRRVEQFKTDWQENQKEKQKRLRKRKREEGSKKRMKSGVASQARRNLISGRAPNRRVSGSKRRGGEEKARRDQEKQR